MNQLRFFVAPLASAILAGFVARLIWREANLWIVAGIALIVGLTVFAALLVFGLRRARWQDAQRARELNALAQIENALALYSDSAQAHARVLDVILEFSHAATAQLWLVSEKDARMESFMQRGLFPESFQVPERVPDQVTFSATLAAVPALNDKGFVERVQIPLHAYGSAIGVLEIAARHRGELHHIAREWFEMVGRALAPALADARELTRMRAQLADEKRLWQAGLDVNATENYKDLLRAIVDHARELIGAEASALCLWDAQKKWWMIQGISGATDAFEMSLAQFERGDGPVMECPVVRFKYRQAHLDLPLQRNGQIVGCLCVANQAPREYSDSERALLASIADQAAYAVERTRALETVGSRAATEERERLAREIHDTLAQILGFVNIKTGAAREFLAQGKIEQAETQLDQLALLSHELYQDTRELILGLRTDAAAQEGLVPALKNYVERFSQFCNLPVTFDAPTDAPQFSPAVEVQLLRVVQEALSNVRKHAHAQHAWVRLTQRDAVAYLEIGDDGQGFDPTNLARGFGPRFGLQSMRERVASVHGTFAVHSSAGQGTRILIELPLIFRGESK